PVTLGYGEAGPALARAGPALVRVGGGFLAVLRGRRRALVLLAPDLTLVRAPTNEVIALLRAPLEAEVAPAIDRWLERSELGTARRARVRAAILGARLEPRPIEGVWMLRRAAWTPFAAELRADGNLGRLVALTAAYLLGYALTILSWWVLG